MSQQDAPAAPTFVQMEGPQETVATRNSATMAVHLWMGAHTTDEPFLRRRPKCISDEPLGRRTHDSTQHPEARPTVVFQTPFFNTPFGVFWVLEKSLGEVARGVAQNVDFDEEWCFRRLFLRRSRFWPARWADPAPMGRRPPEPAAPVVLWVGSAPQGSLWSCGTAGLLNFGRNLALKARDITWRFSAVGKEADLRGPEPVRPSSAGAARDPSDRLPRQPPSRKRQVSRQNPSLER